MYMNPLTIRHNSKIFNLSSTSADVILNGSSNSSVLFQIPNFILKDENVEHVYFSVHHAEIPCTMYLINQYNNTITMTINSSTSTYSLPYGNYNINTMLPALRTLITNVTFAYSLLTSKITMTSTYAFTIIAVSSLISRILGLNKTTNMIATLVTSTYTLELPYVVNFLPISRLTFRSSGLKLNNYHSNDKSNDIFLSLQNNANQNGMILFKNSNDTKYCVEIDNLSVLDIRITDDSGRLIDFNGSAWFITLKLDIEYYPKKAETSFVEILKNNNKLLIEQLQNNDE